MCQFENTSILLWKRVFKQDLPERILQSLQQISLILRHSAFINVQVSTFETSYERSSTLFKNCLFRFSLFSTSAFVLCLPMEAIRYASCSSKQARAAFRSGPLIDSLIFAVSSFFHSVMVQMTIEGKICL